MGVPVSAARAGLGRALRGNGDCWYAEFGGFGEAFVQFAFGLDILARRSSGATGRGHHADGVQAFDGDHLGLGVEQDFADLPTHFLIAALGVAAGLLPMLGNSMETSFAVTGFAGDVALMLASLLALLLCSRVVGAVSRAECQVVLAAAVGAENVFRLLDVQVLDGRRLGYGDLHVQAVMPAVQWCPWSVVGIP